MGENKYNLDRDDYRLLKYLKEKGTETNTKELRDYLKDKGIEWSKAKFDYRLEKLENRVPKPLLEVGEAEWLTEDENLRVKPVTITNKGLKTCNKHLDNSNVPVGISIDAKMQALEEQVNQVDDLAPLRVEKDDYYEPVLVVENENGKEQAITFGQIKDTIKLVQTIKEYLVEEENAFLGDYLPEQVMQDDFG